MSNKQTITKPLADIPKELSGIPGISTGPCFVPITQSRIALGSLPGKGKSTLVHGCPSMLVLDVENSGATVNFPRCVRFGPKEVDGKWYMPSIQEYVAVAEAAIAAKKSGSSSITTIAIDTVDAWLRLHETELKEERNVNDLGDYGPHGEGWRKRSSTFFDMLDRVYKAGLGWVVIGHVQPRTIRVKGAGDITLHSFAISEAPRTVLFGSCEHQLYLDVKEVPITKTVSLPNGNVYEEILGVDRKRVLTPKPGELKFKPGQVDDVKCRVPLPDEIVISEENGWADLTTAYDAAIETLRKRLQ